MPEAEPKPEGVGIKEQPGEHFTTLDTVLLVSGLLFLLVLIYEMHVFPTPGHFLNPPLVGIVGAILLWPVRKLQAGRALLTAGGFLLGLWFVDELSGVLIPFFVVYLLAFLFDPLVDKLEARFGVPRWASSLVITLLLVGLLAAFVLILVPTIISQLQTLATRIAGLITTIRDWVLNTSALDQLQRDFHIDKAKVVEQLSASLQEQVDRLGSSIPLAAQRAIGYVGTLLGLITSLAIMPVILYYTLKDYPYIKRRLVELFPTVGGEREYLERASVILGNYLRGLITISAIAAFNVTIALLIFKVPFALLIGLMAGLLTMIPNLGAIITEIIGVSLMFMVAEHWLIKAITVFLVMIGQGLLEQSVLTPKIMSSQVGLHPVLIVLSLFVFGFFLGFVGLLIAVPATALIMAVYKAYRDELSFELAGTRPPIVRRPLFRRRARRHPKAEEEGAVIYPPEEPGAKGGEGSGRE
ncbi:MAG TPA: AI-2E family transporter [Rhodothermales bacterium]|nr:AI-2E family transporter [Rhodothermales bacterium]